jgi:hypothetical protein
MISAIFNITLGGLNDESTYDCVLFSWLLSVIQWPFRVIHRRLVSPMLSRLRYKFRYFSKFRRRVKDHDTFSLRPLPTKLRKPNKPTALAVALNLESQLQLYNGPLNYDIWALIASRLHGVDLINLSLVSKSFRERIFPTSELGTRSEALRAYACDDGTKSQCWICNIKICDVR